MGALTIGLAIVLAGQSGTAREVAEGSLPARQARAVLERMMVIELFLGSADERQSRAAVGHYFSHREYVRLRGNPIVGYWDVGSFKWAGGEKFSWGGIRNAHPTARPITPAAWDAAMRQVAGKQGLQLSRDASVRLEGACVAAVVDATKHEPVPGVLLELRLTSPTGVLLYRVGVGKATVEDAMGAALDLVLSFARSQQEAGKGAVREPAR